MKMKMKLLAVALSAIGVAGPAHAGAIAQSLLEISNFQFLNAANGAVLDVSQFASLNIVDTTNLNPTFGAFANPFSAFSVGGAPLPTNVRCARESMGTLCGGMPAPFTPQLGPALGTENGAQAASDLKGAPITGLIPLNPPVLARTDAIASRTTTGAANTTSALSLATSFRFTPLTDLSVIVDFFGLLHLLANADTLVNAGAGSVWSINIINHVTRATVFDWTPDGFLNNSITGGTEQADTCDLTRSLGQFGPNANPATFDCAAGSHYRATTDLLLAANTYDLAITHQNQANVLVQAVPEPSTILLAGFALACLGVGFRRKSESDN